MTDLSAEQNAMLERLCRKHELGWSKSGAVHDWSEHNRALAALRELLLAVQERDAYICYQNMAECVLGAEWCHRTDVERIRAQTYADLFLKEE